MHRIIFIQGIYDTLDLFSEELNKAFMELGYPTFTFRTANEREDRRMLMELLKEPAVLITFNNQGYNLELEKGKNAWETYEVPYVNILMDHPFHYARQLEKMPSTAVILTIDRRHVAYLHRFYPQLKKVGFLPHGGCSYLMQQKVSTDASKDGALTDISDEKTRTIPVLYAGTLSKYKIESLIPEFSQFTDFDGAAMSGEVLAELAKHPEKTTEQAIEEYLESIGLCVGKNIDDAYLCNVITQMRFIDGYAVSFFREQAVRILVDSGIPVTVYGEGWKECEWSSADNLTLDGKVLASQVLPLMQRSRIVLNTMTWFKDGTHDRVFNGLLAGAAVVSDPSDYMREQYEDEKEISYFELNSLGALPELVNDLLCDEEKRKSLSDAGRMKTLAKHTWKNRAEELVTLLGL